MITDDLKSIPSLREFSSGKVKIRSSILIPFILLSSKEISKKKAKQIVTQISKQRKWDETLFRRSLELLDHNQQ